MIADAKARCELARLIGEVIDQAARRQTKRQSQEPSISSRVGAKMEGSYGDFSDDLWSAERKANLPAGYSVRIATHDVPDRGGDSLEKKSGADMYVSVSVQGPEGHASKGFLVQAKKAGNRRGLKEQCEKMKAQTDAAYGWVYSERGCDVIDAQAIIDASGRMLKELPKRSVQDLFEQVLKCVEGDPELGLEPAELAEDDFTRIERRLGAGPAVSFLIQAPARGC